LDSDPNYILLSFLAFKARACARKRKEDVMDRRLAPAALTSLSCAAAGACSQEESSLRGPLSFSFSLRGPRLD